MKITDKISNDIIKWADKGSNDIVIPNFFIGKYEMDLFKMTGSGYIIEYEIKVSRSDFINDFKKGNKHELLKQGKLDSNRFFFVVPKGLISIEEVPDYCGLIYYDDTIKYLDGKFEIKKHAKILHKIKKREDNKFLMYLLNKLAFRDSLNKLKINNLKRKNILINK